MKKNIRIFIDDKEVSMDDLFDEIFDCKEPVMESEVPAPYADALEYLSLHGLKLDKCIKEKIVKDLGDKLDKRLGFARKFKDEIRKEKNYNIFDAIVKSKKEYYEDVLNQIRRKEIACKAVLLYLSKLDETLDDNKTGKKED